MTGRQASLVAIAAVLVIVVSMLSIFYPIIRYGVTGILLQ